MYRTAIGYSGGLVCDAKLTTASFGMWSSLGRTFYTYLVDENNEVTEVGNFDASMMGSEAVRFMVTENEYEQEEIY
jgi:hypothetical protein